MKAPLWSIAESIGKHAQSLGGYVKLADAIKQASQGQRQIDRRKLKAIAVGDEFTISTNELMALDAYFAPLGEGLGERPLFARNSILKSMALNDELRVPIGAFQRNAEERNDVSLWDVNAFQEVLAGMREFKEHIQSNVDDIPFFDAKGKHNQGDRRIPKLLNQQHVSISSIGSPRSNVATEIILAEMMGIRPFQKSAARLPFRFYWPPDPTRAERNVCSAFEASESELLALLPSLRPRLGPQSRVSALVCGDKAYVVIPSPSKAWQDYGIVAIQKCSDRRVRVVIAGLTGPSTLACARACRTFINSAFGPAPDDAAGRVMWILVECIVNQAPTGVGDLRSLENYAVIDGPRTITSQKS